MDDPTFIKYPPAYDLNVEAIPPPPPEKRRKRNLFVLALVALVGVLFVGLIGILIYRVSTHNIAKLTPSLLSAAHTPTTISNTNTCMLAIKKTSTSIELIGNEAKTACNKVSAGVVFSQMLTPTTPCADLQACTDTNPVDYVERMQYNLANEYQYNLYVEANSSHASPEICEVSIDGMRFIVYDTLATTSATNTCNYFRSG